MLRNLLQVGRSCLHGELTSGARMMATGSPKQTLEQYVEGLRTQIADAYNERVQKYDSYITEFGKYVAVTGLPRAKDFSGVKAFAKKRADILKQVGFPSDWKVQGTEVDKIKELLKQVPALRSAGDSNAPWYATLTDTQVAECEKDPQLFVELMKINTFEEQFALASEAQSTKFGLPPISLDELPATMEPIGESVISANEAKWILDTAKKQADDMRKTNPEFSDPFTSSSFMKVQETIADKLGMSKEDLTAAQAEMSSDKWRKTADAAGVAF